MSLAPLKGYWRLWSQLTAGRIVPIVPAAWLSLGLAVGVFGQEAVPQMQAYSSTVPWTGGTVADALGQVVAGTTIPMSSYAVAFGKGGAYTGVLVGSDPFAASPGSVTLDAVLIPLVVQIITPNGTLVTFDPTKKNNCDGGVSALTRFKQSPLVVKSKLTFNGVSVGSHQYIDGFMRAEFWSVIQGTGFGDPISWSYAPAFTLPPFLSATGIVIGSGCNQMGIVSKDFMDVQLNLLPIPLLQAAGTISPTQFAAFLLKNVVMSSADPPTSTACCIYGYHSAVGSPVQTYGAMDYDTTGRLGNVHDTSGPAHEIGEWMNDPLVNNATPAWGHIGQVSGCQSNLEVGDPLSGTNMPVITLSGYSYHVQELAFFSWFFNSKTTPSLGAGGEFSGNGTFKGPAKACPPGGTF